MPIVARRHNWYDDSYLDGHGGGQSVMTRETDDLSDLLKQIAAGDDAALMQLLQRYEAQLRVAARVLLGPKLRAQMDSLDLVQSVHRVLLPGLRDGKYDVSTLDKLLALARTVVRNKVIRNWRRVQREQATRSKKAATDPENRGAIDDPAHAILTEDLKRSILSGLSGLDRQLVELRIQGYSTGEIAQRLNCDPHALRARLSRLRQRLREQGVHEWL